MPADWAAIAPHSITDFRGPPTLASAYFVTWGKASGYGLAFVALWACFVVLLRLAGCGKTICGARRGTWALKSAMLVHHSVITTLAFVGMWEDVAIIKMYRCNGCAEAAAHMNRAPLPPYAARALVPITLGYFIGDLLLLSQWNLTKSGAVENGLMLFHHVASLLVWPAAVYFDWVARYVIIMLSYEFTGIWLTLLWMLSTAGLKKNPAYIVVGLLFTFSFVGLRLVGAVPQLIAMWNAPPWSPQQELAADPKGIHAWCWIFSVSLVFPHLLNFFWGVKVVNGFLSLAFGAGKKKEKKDKDN
mmetsp:Transcript_30967/g.82034  ORF Transcript_30967/g.82034 Transcript_30967/m.82034 type:complete len:302 (-) Transcript_30967:65-970(-)